MLLISFFLSFILNTLNVSDFIPSIFLSKQNINSLNWKIFSLNWLRNLVLKQMNQNSQIFNLNGWISLNWKIISLNWKIISLNWKIICLNGKIYCSVFHPCLSVCVFFLMKCYWTEKNLSFSALVLQYWTEKLFLFFFKNW